MPLAKVRRVAQITLPVEVPDKLKVKEGDYEAIRYIGPEPRPSPEEEGIYRSIRPCASIAKVVVRAVLDTAPLVSAFRRRRAVFTL